MYRSGVCHQPADKKWGSVPTAAGEWQGILGELKRGDADVGLPFFGNTRDRFEIVEFAHPFGQKWLVNHRQFLDVDLALIVFSQLYHRPHGNTTYIKDCPSEIGFMQA